MLSNTQNDDLLVSLFKTYGTLTGEAEQELKSKVRSIVKKKGSYIIREGQIASSFYVIEKGLLRSFYQKGDEEVTVWFGYEGQSFAAISSFFSGGPSHETIQCLEDCEFQYISGKDINVLFDKYNDVNTIGRKIVEDYCMMLDSRIYYFQTLSAEERYKHLLQDIPEVIRRVPLIYIASYLGISPETLSRVRKK